MDIATSISFDEQQQDGEAGAKRKEVQIHPDFLSQQQQDENSFRKTPHPSKKMRPTSLDVPSRDDVTLHAVSYDESPMAAATTSGSNTNHANNDDDDDDALNHDHHGSNNPQEEEDTSTLHDSSTAPHAHEQHEDDVVDAADEPDWDQMAQNEPSTREQIDLFIKARSMRDDAEDRMRNVLDECNLMLEESKKQILQTAATVFNLYRQDMDMLESEIKQTMIWNDETRVRMTQELEDTRSRAQGLFSQLLMNVSQPLMGALGHVTNNDNSNAGGDDANGVVGQH